MTVTHSTFFFLSDSLESFLAAAPRGTRPRNRRIPLFLLGVAGAAVAPGDSGPGVRPPEDDDGDDDDKELAEVEGDEGGTKGVSESTP